MACLCKVLLGGIICLAVNTQFLLQFVYKGKVKLCKKNVTLLAQLNLLHEYDYPGKNFP